MQQRPPSRAGLPPSPPNRSGSGIFGGLPPRRPGSSGRGGGGFRIDDRIILASVLIVLGASLVLFASLIVTGAGKFGGDDPEPEEAALDAGLVAGASTPAPTNAAAPSVPPTATAAPGADSGTQLTGDSPTVCIDVGHGGVDLGNVRESEDGTEILLMEKELVLDIALALRDRLEAQGINVVLTRETDTEVNSDFADVNGDGEVSEDVDGDGVINPDGGEDIVDNLDEQAARVNLCNAAGADLLFSIHANSSGNPELGGVETYWAEDSNLSFVAESKEVATLAYEKLTEEFAALGFEPGGRGAAPDHAWEPIDDNPHTFDHYILLSPDRPDRNFVGAKMPAVIVECLFVTNDDDYAFLTNDPESAQGAIITAYEEAILEYFETEPTTNGADQTEDDAEPVPTPTPEATVDEEDAEETPEAGDEDADSAETDPDDIDAVAEANNLPPPLPDTGNGASQVHYYGDSGRKEIALTFDLGSDRGHTETILDFLKERGIRASFGLTGLWAEQNPDLVQRIVNEGHQLFNHTYSHSSFTGDSTGADPLTHEERIEEIERTHEIVMDIAGYDMRPYFRLPYGDGADDPQVMEDIYGAGYYLTIMWTCDSYGWKQWTPAEIIQHCYEETGQGGIVLMHVGSDGTDQDALPGLVDEFAADGYDFVTVAEVLAPAEEDDA
jgi:peptidoglycan/xylan/chitin deacetylase (PgdA/CDA1 family)/N-acetylmuramoyl-L-alanine amidase